MRKCRLAPLKAALDLKAISIPRLELITPTMAACMEKVLRYELNDTIIESVF